MEFGPLADWIDAIWPYCGDLHLVMPLHWTGLVLVICSAVCGLIFGLEREIKHKPAGLRTVTLICVGSTLFTISSILVAGDAQFTDRGRIAAQIVTGIGFLGAGAIIRERGIVIGLTTGATIWVVAAIGLMVGSGYAAAGLCMTVVLVTTLFVFKRIQRVLQGGCRYSHCQLLYDIDSGKTRIRILRVLDEFKIPDERWEFTPSEHGQESMQIRYCHFHNKHRSFLTELVDIPRILEIQHERAPRMDEEEPDEKA